MSVREILENNPVLVDQLLNQLVKIAACKKKKMKKTAMDKTQIPKELLGHFPWKESLGVAGGALALMGLSRLDNFLDSRERQKSYNEMLAQKKELKSTKNPMLVLQYFNALYEMAPEVAKNPAAAASFVTSSLDMGDSGLNISSLNTLSGITKNLGGKSSGGNKTLLHNQIAALPSSILNDIGTQHALQAYKGTGG
jgi:hypothetical protein